MRVGLWSRLRPLRRGAERAGPSRGSAPISPPGTPLPDPFPDLPALYRQQLQEGGPSAKAHVPGRWWRRLVLGVGAALLASLCVTGLGTGSRQSSAGGESPPSVDLYAYLFIHPPAPPPQPPPAIVDAAGALPLGPGPWGGVVSVEAWLAAKLRPHQREGVAFLFRAVMGQALCPSHFALAT